jgi:hypothetical protein
MSLADNIPDYAIKVHYKCSGLECKYYIWKREDGRWNWVALGNNGTQPTAERAMSAARLWISQSESNPNG